MNYKRVYLDGYSYFLTVVTFRREPILIDNIELLRDSFRGSKEKYSYRIDAIVILPEHFHMIITPKVSTDYSKIIRHIKRSFVYGLDEKFKSEAKLFMSESKYKRGHAGVWQERFYEHTIRDEKDLLEKIEYIKNNPIKHQLVEKLEDWKYTSFYKKR